MLSDLLRSGSLVLQVHLGASPSVGLQNAPFALLDNMAQLVVLARRHALGNALGDSTALLEQ
jgi:hypothetical protein